MNKLMFFCGLAIIAVQITGGLLYLALTTLSFTWETWKILILIAIFVMLNITALVLVLKGLSNDN